VGIVRHAAILTAPILGTNSRRAYKHPVTPNAATIISHSGVRADASSYR
jgi:hypothetical protein